MEAAPTLAPARVAVGSTTGPVNSFACLILARNESDSIQQTLASIQAALPPGVPVLVAADHCEDDTARQAEQAGATVLVRDGGSPSSKGAALTWVLQEHWDLLRDLPAVLILDADSGLAPSAGAAIAAHLGQEAAFQCRVAPAGYDGSPLATLIALSEILEQSVHERLRSRLGWPVRLRGTGMLIPPAVLRNVCAEIDTEAEDIALTLLLAASGVAIRRIEDAVVYDPKPRQAAPAARQRARWFRGQWAALRRYRRQVLQLAGQGPRGWSVLAALFLKPRWLVSSLSLVLALALMRWPWASAAFWAIPSAEAGMLAFGLLCLGSKRTGFLKALLHLPAFALMWARGIMLALGRSGWLRARG
jgi:cellulose synthase/poly-beta-1,6-N-acetylglucosamine synthase-like glycosyltransferase